MAKSQREVPPALEGNDFVITASVTAAWGVALVVLLSLRHDIPTSSHWWIWTCAAGFGMGLFGLVYVPHLKRSRARSAARRAENASNGSAGRW
jgi:H+/Cl- antiporter ClcA